MVKKDEYKIGPRVRAQREPKNKQKNLKKYT